MFTEINTTSAKAMYGLDRYGLELSNGVDITNIVSKEQPKDIRNVILYGQKTGTGLYVVLMNANGPLISIRYSIDQFLDQSDSPLLRDFLAIEEFNWGLSLKSLQKIVAFYSPWNDSK